MQTPKLVLKTNEREYSFELHEGRILFAGRTVECDICLPSPAVSRRHAIVVMRGGKCGLKDMGSGNGTYLNGKRLEGPVKLRHGDRIQIATHILEFVSPPPERYEQAAQTLLLPSDKVLPILNGAIKELAASAEAPAPAASAPTVPVAATPAPATPKTPAPPAPPAPAASAASAVPAATVETPKKEDTGRRSATETALPPVQQREEEEATSSSQRRLHPETVRKVRESIRLTPKAPPAPKVQSEAAEDEIGDGSGDSGLQEIVQSGNGNGNGQEQDAMELSKKAAEVGLIGEFAPETPEDHDLMDVKEALEADDDDDDEVPAASAPPADSGQSPSAPAALPALSIQPSDSALLGDMQPLPPGEANPDAIPIRPDFRQAIESRLFYYSFMEDLHQERARILVINPDAADSVKSEIDRQDREMGKPPNADQAADRIEKVNARRATLREKIKKAKEEGSQMPPRPSKLMREVEDIGINQWTIIAQSLREALPAAFAAGYEVVKDEPLAGVLAKEGIDAKTVMGGAAYCLALEEMLAEAKFNRAVVKENLSQLPPPDEKKSGGGGLLSKFSRHRPQADDDEGEDGDSYESLAETERLLGLRATWITQEMAFAEAMLIKEFWDVYLRVALRFVPEHRGMPLCVRAFMRHGVIGFKRWWLKEPVRRFVEDDCTNEVRQEFEVGEKITNVVYADEYLSAVMEEKCTPAMDENLEINERNSPNWKADKALRKLISARGQMVRTQELLDSLQSRIDKNEEQSALLDQRIAALLPGSKNFKQAKQELSQDRQAFRIEVSKLNKLAEKLSDSMKGELTEAISDTEERFASGELPRPTPEFLIEREVGQVRRIGRLTSNLKERLLPLAMREYQVDTDAANDRLSIIGELADIERRDPRIFLETIVPSKKKASRVDMRISPVVVLLPAAGLMAFSWNPRQKPEDGRLALPTFFTRQRIRERQITYLLSDFRWDTAKASAGMDLMNSETIVAEFMRVRWDWRKRSKEMREKGLVYTEQNDRTNWRRVYEAYLTTAFDGGKKLYNRNYDFYERIIGKYFDLPEGVDLLRK